MPQAGTRRVEIDGQKTYLPGEDARIVELLQAGLRLQQRIEGEVEQLQAIKDELAEIAAGRRGSQSTVYLTSPDGQEAKVTWRKDYPVDPVRAEQLREPLGKAFSKVFATKTTYSLARGYKRFMQLPQGELEALKKRVAAAFAPREHRPAVTLTDNVEVG